MYKRQAKVADTAPEALRAMVGEFANELLSQAWRQKILEAVSYTHLRAHETVLDLVCRLLPANKIT